MACHNGDAESRRMGGAYTEVEIIKKNKGGSKFGNVEAIGEKGEKGCGIGQIRGMGKVESCVWKSDAVALYENGALR